MNMCACVRTRLNGKFRYVLNSYSQIHEHVHTTYSRSRCGWTYESINVMSSVNDHLFYISLLTQKCRKVSEKKTKHERYTKKLFIHIFIGSFVRRLVRMFLHIMRETNRFRSMFLAQHTFIYSWAHTYVFRNRCDSHSVHTIRRYTHFTICCMQKITKKTNENSRKQPGTNCTEWNSWPK